MKGIFVQLLNFDTKNIKAELTNSVVVLDKITIWVCKSNWNTNRFQMLKHSTVMMGIWFSEEGALFLYFQPHGPWICATLNVWSKARGDTALIQVTGQVWNLNPRHAGVLVSI